MKILFFIPATGYYNRALSNPLGALSICTYLKNHGHTVKIVDNNITRLEPSNEIAKFAPDMVAVSLMSSRGIDNAIRISAIAKKFGKTVVWGGQMPTMQPQLALQCKYVDYVIMNEGEKTFLEFANTMECKGDIKKLDGIAYRMDGKLVKTKKREFLPPEELPIIDWTLIDPTKYFQKYIHCEKMLYLYSAKGCPCCCTFCGNKDFHRCTHRKRPNENVIAEIETLVNRYGMDGVYFSDELWCVDKADMHEFCRLVKEKKLHFSWGCQARIDQYSREELDEMYSAGCRWIIYGVESGSREILKRIRKGIDYDRIPTAIENTKAAGITAIASFIIGYPDETAEQLRDTVQLIARMKANLNTLYYFIPMPGSELYEQLVAQGKYTAPKTLDEVRRVVPTETLEVNFSKVPDIDLHVIRNCIHWKGFVGADSVNNSSKPFAFAAQTVVDGLKSISNGGIEDFITGGFTAAKEFSSVMWYANAYPEIINKYGLK